MRDAPVLDDAAQLQAELDGAERQPAALFFKNGRTGCLLRVSAVC
jgi:hypothetical protein